MVHHLFPAVDPSHYRDLAPVVAAVCAEHGVTYTAFRSWPEAWARHVGWVARLNAADPAASAAADCEGPKTPRAAAAAAAAAAARLDQGEEARPALVEAAK